jgi:Ca2+-binding RTX toxin-like protein
MLERLETRRLLDATLANNTLTVTGNSFSDEIQLSLVDGRVVVIISPLPFRQTFLLRDIKRISIDGDDGDDRIFVDVAINRRCTIMGGDGNDTIRGGGGADSLNGGTGDDILDGGLDGGINPDTLFGGDGTDIVDYRFRVTPLKIDLDGNSDDGAAGEGDNVDATCEIILGGGGADIITSNLSTPVTLYGNAGNDTLSTSGGSDRLVGGPDDDMMTSRGGDDTLIGGHGNDTFNGGAGSDTASYYYTDIKVDINLDGIANDGAPHETDLIMSNIENLTGGDGPDTITGNDGANLLEGLSGNDSITALGGDDTINGGAGSDTVSGSTGIDTVTYRGRNQNLTLTIDGMANDGAPGENDNIGFDIEIVEGGDADDMITGSAAGETLRGHFGDDVIFGAGGNDSLDGGDGDDTLDGQQGADIISGGAGRDTTDYSSRTANLIIVTDDIVGDGEIGENDNVMNDIERILGGSGNDSLDGQSGSETLIGNAGNDTLIGGSGNDLLDGGAGDDFIDASGAGRDTMTGGVGVDTIDYSARMDGVSVSLDNTANDGDNAENDNVLDAEIIQGSQANDTMTGGALPDVFFGNGGDDSITGGDGNDTIDGGAGDDNINGGDDDDSIIGGTGSDSLNGGDDDDIINALDGVADTIDGGMGTDIASADPLIDMVTNVP